MIKAFHLQRAFGRTEKYRRVTPLIRINSLSDEWSADIYIKCENLQEIGAFKIRGASNFALKLSLSERARGFVTHSSGNHAQAVAYMANRLGVDTHVVMPDNSNKQKIKNAEKWGAKIYLCAPTFESRLSTAENIQDAIGATMIPPFDHEWIIEGQATCAMEVFYKKRDVDMFITPLGGGGLLAGSALAAKFFSPTTKVYGAEPEQASDGYEGFRRGERVTQFTPDTVADGLRTTVGELPFTYIQEDVDDIMLAPEADIIPWMKRLWKDTKLIIEPSCAVPFAAMAQQAEAWKGKQVVVVITGGNVDMDQLSFDP